MSNLKRTISIAVLGLAIIGILTACSQKASPTTETTPVTFTLPELFLIPPDNTKAVISVNYNEVKSAFQAANPDAARALAEKIDSFLATIPDSTEDDPITIIVFGMNNGEDNASFVLVTHDKQIYMAGSTNQQGESTAIGAPLYAGNTVNGIGVFYDIGNERVILLEETSIGINIFDDKGTATFNPESTLDNIDKSGKLASLVPIGNDKTPEYYKNLEGKWIEVQGDFVQDGESILVWTGTEFISTSVPEGFKPNHLEKKDDTWLLYGDDESALIWDGTDWVKAKTTYTVESWNTFTNEQKDKIISESPAKSPDGGSKDTASTITGLDYNVYYVDSSGKTTSVLNTLTGEFVPADKAEVCRVELSDGSTTEMKHLNTFVEALQEILKDVFVSRGDNRMNTEKSFTFLPEANDVFGIVKKIPERKNSAIVSLPRSGPDFFTMYMFNTETGGRIIFRHQDGTFEIIDFTVQGDFKALKGSLYSGDYDRSITLPPLPSTP